MYESPDPATGFDKLDEGSSLKVLRQDEKGFVFVDYFGNDGYVRVEDLNY